MSRQGRKKQAHPLTTEDRHGIPAVARGEGVLKTVCGIFVFSDFILWASVCRSSSNDLFKVRRCLLKWP